METLNLSDILEIKKEIAFKIISSVEKYPEYVPGYKQVNLLEKRDDYIKAEIVPSIPIKNIIMEAFLFFPDKIIFKQIKGPLDVFEGTWYLDAVDENRTKIDFKLKYYVKKFLLRKIIYKFVKLSFKDIITSFKIMAKKMYKE